MSAPTVYWSGTRARFEWSGGFRTKDLPKGAGFRWDGTVKVWWTADPARVLRLKEYAVDNALEKLAEVEAKIQSSAQLTLESCSPEIREAAEYIVAPEGCKFRGYQIVGIASALLAYEEGKYDGILLGDQQGLGKTPQAIGFWAALQPTDEDRLLVVCPASVRLVWERELGIWDVSKSPLQVITSGKQAIDLTARVIVINYDLIARKRQEISWWLDGANGRKILVADEAHYLTNAKALRTRTIYGKDEVTKEGDVVGYGFADRIEFYLCLTGTPIPVRPRNLWPTLEILDPRGFGEDGFFKYARRYCDAHRSHWGTWDFDGASNLDELQQRLRSSVLIRRIKSEVAREIPPKVFKTVEIGKASAKETKALKLLSEGVEKAREAYSDALASGEGVIPALQEYQKELKEFLSIVESGGDAFGGPEYGLSKVEASVEYIKDIYDGENPILVFATHRVVSEALRDALSSHGPTELIYGGTSHKARKDIVDRFQAGQVAFLVANIRAAGTGLTLTRSSDVVFVEYDWSPAALEQAEDRVHRIGQDDQVVIHRLLIRGGFDSYILPLVLLRQSQTQEALDVTPVALARQFEEEAAEARRQNLPVTTPAPVRRRILEALRYLAARCDGAAQDDGIGFNGRHAAIGRSLSQCHDLTDRQIEVAHKILTTYKNTQLTSFSDLFQP